MRNIDSILEDLMEWCWENKLVVKEIVMPSEFWGEVRSSFISGVRDHKNFETDFGFPTITETMGRSKQIQIILGGTNVKDTR